MTGNEWVLAFVILGSPLAVGFLLGWVVARGVDVRTLVREWINRRYVEADWRWREAHTLNWWDDRYLMRLYRRREFWARLGGQG